MAVAVVAQPLPVEPVDRQRHPDQRQRKQDAPRQR